MNCARQTSTSTSQGREASREAVAGGAIEVIVFPFDDEADDPIRFRRAL
jgi:hypothetical protein